MRSAPEAATQARGLGQPSRGLMSRSRDSPKLAIARAAAPTLSPSCGSTRTTIGPPAIQSLVLSVPDPGMAASFTSSIAGLATSSGGPDQPPPRRFDAGRQPWPPLGESALQDGAGRAI